MIFLQLTLQTVLSNARTNTLQRPRYKQDFKIDYSNEWMPMEQYAMRKLYQSFHNNTFEKHIHQEKEKQHTAPFWRLKRNIDAHIQISKEQSLYKQGR